MAARSVPRYLTFVATSTKTLLVFEASLIKLMDVCKVDAVLRSLLGAEAAVLIMLMARSYRHAGGGGFGSFAV